MDEPEVADGARDLLGLGAIADGIAEEIAPNLRQGTMRLEQAASAAAEADPDADVTGGSNCGVSVVRFVQGSGAFHPKLVLLACKQRGLRVVIGSANLTRAGMTHQIELVSSSG